MVFQWLLEHEFHLAFLGQHITLPMQDLLFMTLRRVLYCFIVVVHIMDGLIYILAPMVDSRLGFVHYIAVPVSFVAVFDFISKNFIYKQLLKIL